MTVLFVKNAIINGHEYFSGEIANLGTAAENTQISAGTAISYPSAPQGTVPTRTFSIENYGDGASGFWDGALAATLTAMGAAGGGILTFGATTYAFANQWPAIPTDATNHAVPVKIQGAGGGFNGHWDNVLNTGTVLDLQYAAGSNGKILLTGNGLFVARDVIFTDSTASGGYLIYTTYTTMDIQNCVFRGINSFPINNTAPNQDAICWGGTTTTTTNTSTSASNAFQGYNSSVRNCFFQSIRRGLYGRVYCNGNVFQGNTFASGCGTKKSGVSTDTTPLIEFDGLVAGSNCTGNVIRDNLFEMQYADTAIKLTQSTLNIVGPNGFYDAIGNTTACITLGTIIGTFTGTLTNNSTSITSVTQPLLLTGMAISAAGLLAGTTVSNFVSTTVTSSLAAKQTGSQTISFGNATNLNVIQVGANACNIPSIVDNTCGQPNQILNNGANVYNQFDVSAFPIRLQASAGQFGSPTGASGVPVLVTPDWPASSGMPNPVAVAAAIANGTRQIAVLQSVADGAAYSFQVTYDGTTTFGIAATSGQMSGNGMNWQALGSGGAMKWSSGTGGSYASLRHFGLQYQKYTDGTVMQNAAGTGNGTEIWTTNNYISKNFVEVTTPIAVAFLPGGASNAGNAAVSGMRYIVNDATATTFVSTVAGGGANTVPVYYNGSNWVIG